MIIKNISKQCNINKCFRKVVHTSAKSQIVYMCLDKMQDIGLEVHAKNDQTILITKGDGEAMLDGKKTKVTEGDVVFVHAGVQHNITNTANKKLKLISIYAPPAHYDGITHKTKNDACLEP